MIQRLARLQYRLFDRMRHRDAFRVAEQQPTAADFELLGGHHYCLLVTFRRSGEPVPTPVLFGMQDGKLYLRTDAATAKVAAAPLFPTDVCPWCRRPRPSPSNCAAPW